MKKRWLKVTSLMVCLSGVLFATVGFAAEQRFPVIFDAEQRAVLSAERAGMLTSLRVDVGDNVKKGQVLASVYTGDLGLSRKGERLTADFLKVQLDSLTRLNKRGLATNEELAKTKMEAGVSKVKISMLTNQISRSQVRAPFSGVVVQRMARAHEWMEEGKPVVEILNPNRIRIVSSLPSKLVVQMAIGSKHLVFVPVLNLEVEAVLDATVPAVDEQSNTIGVILNISNPPAGLLAGMKGELSL